MNNKNKKGKLCKLERLAEASAAGDFIFGIDEARLSDEEAEAICLIKKIISNYRETTEYEIMKYKLTNDALNIALWDMNVVNGDLVNPENKFTWSQEFRHMLGFSDENDFPNTLRSWSDRLHPEDKEMVLDAFTAHMNDHTGNIPYDVEYRLMLKNGEYQHFHAFGETLRDRNGIPIRVAGAIMDVHEKKQTAQALQEAILETNKTLDIMIRILNNSSAMIYVTDPDTNEILFINEPMKQHYGIEGCIGEFCYKVFQDDRNERCDFCPCHQLDREPGKVIVWEEYSSLTGRFYQNSDQYVDWPGGKKAHIQHSIDITDIKKTQEQLEYRKKLAETLNKMAILLLTQTEESFEEQMTKSVWLISNFLDLDRVSIWRNFSMPDSLHVAQIYRWDKESGGTTMPKLEFKDLSYVNFAPDWIEVLLNNKSLNGPVKLFSNADVLKSFGCMSVFVDPIFIDDELWGFALFEDIHNERFFDVAAVYMMQAATMMFANSVIRFDLQRKISEENEFNRVLYESSPIGIEIHTAKYECLNCSDTVLNMLQTTEEYFKTHQYEFSPEYQPDGQKSHEKAKDLIDKALNGETITSEWMHISASGEHIPCEITLTRTKRHNQYVVLVYTYDLRHMRSIEEKEREARIQSEAAQAASKTKNQFLAHMSHEIRTPMNAILGMSELLMQEQLSSRQLRYVGDIRTSAVALLDIINDILDISKIQAGKFSLVPVHYDFNAMIENLKSIVQFLIDDKNIAFKLDIQEGTPTCLYGDDVRLRQVLLNLLSNAIKFTKKGYVQLSISYTDTIIKMTVSDTGMGIPSEKIPRLFEAFEQADRYKNRKTTGTGLGLTITKTIIEMMDGQITVESVYEQGTSVCVEIPKMLGDESLLVHTDSKEVPLYAPNAEILIVDDNQINLNVASGLLQLYHILVDTANSGQEAIEMVQQKQYDLVFMDHMMPEMTGVETTKIIRDLGINVPIIALTASAVVGAKEALLEAGMDDYLAKPIIKFELQQILNKWLPATKLLETPTEVMVAENSLDDRHKAFWDAIEQIEDISLSEGLDRLDGERDIYKKMLKLLLQENIKSMKKVNELLSANDMQRFHIEVHGLKGALANLGMIGLSAKALELETASGKLDVDFCKKNVPALLEGINGLNAKLLDAFSIIEESEDLLEIPLEIPSIFQRMKEAFSEIDIVRIDEEVQNLDALNLSDSLKDEIEQIKDMVMMMDYDGATERIQTLLNKV